MSANKKIVILGGGTFNYVRAHFALATPAFGATACYLEQQCEKRFKNMDVEYQSVLESINRGNERGIIICETGGKLAHMAIVGREYDVTILMVPDALTKYGDGELLHIDLTNQIIMPTAI